MTERLIAKLDRLGAEAGIKEMTPEIYRFSQLLNDDKLKQWDEWRSQRTWIGLTDEEYKELHLQMGPVYYYQEYGQAIEAKLKEKNTRQDGDCKHCVNGCPACDARRQSNVLP